MDCWLCGLRGAWGVAATVGDRQLRVGEISDWALHGRLALSNGRDGGSGQLTWRQGLQEAELRFIGALGRGSWRLQVTAEQAELETAESGLLRAPDVGSLVRDHLGWEIPVDSMRYWVVGMRDPERRGTRPP